MKTTTTSPTKTTDATEIARIANRHHFSAWHGFGEVGGEAQTFYLFSNAPSDDRPRILGELCDHMKARGCELLSSGSYPEKGEEEAGYTVALIFASWADHSARADLEALRIFYQAAAIRLFPGQCGYPNGTVHHTGTVLELVSTRAS